MLYGLLLTFFVILCFLLMALILIQKSKGSLGLGNIGGGMQMLFGGSGGQSLFQKVTWVLGALFMLSSLGLAILKSSKQEMRYAGYQPAAPVRQGPQPVIPTAPVQATPPATTEPVKAAEQPVQAGEKAPEKPSKS